MSNIGKDATIGFLSGDWMPRSEMRIALEDFAFLQGVTAVERLRSYGGKLFQVPAHLARLQRCLTGLQIEAADYDFDSLLRELVVRNADWIATQTAFGVTLFVTPGLFHADQPTVGLHCNALDPVRIARHQHEGQPLVLTDVHQPSERCWPRSWKVRTRLHYYLADQAARKVHPEALGVLRDDDGSLTETSVANLAIVAGETIVSPPRDRVLPGITQEFLQRHARLEGIPWRHQPLRPAELRQADEILLFGTTAGVWNGYCDDSDLRPPAGGGPMCRRLRAAFPHGG